MTGLAVDLAAVPAAAATPADDGADSRAAREK